MFTIVKPSHPRHLHVPTYSCLFLYSYQIVSNTAYFVFLTSILHTYMQTSFNERGVHYVFNHIDIRIKYHDGAGEDWDGARLMSAIVTPRRYENMLLFMILISLGPITCIIKFSHNAHSEWLKQPALSENRERVDDGKLAFKFLLQNFDKFDPNYPL